MEDKENIYDEKIAPLMKQIIDICKEHGMPLAATIQYNEDARCTSILPQEYQSADMDRACEAIQPRHHFAMAITETTQDGGSKHISIRRVN